MPLLYYWRPDNYYRDLDAGAGYHLNQANPRMHAIAPGDSLWAFTRNRAGRYVAPAASSTPGPRAVTLPAPPQRSPHPLVFGQPAGAFRARLCGNDARLGAPAVHQP